jgi:hypothetical protein
MCAGAHDPRGVFRAPEAERAPGRPLSPLPLPLPPHPAPLCRDVIIEHRQRSSPGRATRSRARDAPRPTRDALRASGGGKRRGGEHRGEELRDALGALRHAADLHVHVPRCDAMRRKRATRDGNLRPAESARNGKRRARADPHVIRIRRARARACARLIRALYRAESDKSH